MYAHEWSCRCDECDLPCSSIRGIAIHKTHKHNKADKQQNFKGTLAEEAVKVCKLVKQQDNIPNIYCDDCDGEKLENVFRFNYLGMIFTADARQKYDLKTRVTKAFTRYGELRNVVIDDPNLSTDLKLRLYQSVVCSILTYICETWRLTPPVMRQINGANSRMLASIIGKTIPQDRKRPSQ